MEINSKQIQSLDFKRRCSFFFILVSMLVFPFNQLKSQNFNQSEFVIGTYGERNMDLARVEIGNYLANPASVTQSFLDRQNFYINHLTGIKNAHFNLMSGLLFFWGTNTSGYDNHEILYSMNLIGSTPHLSGLKRLVKNHELFGRIEYPTNPASLVPGFNVTYSYWFDDVYSTTGPNYNFFCPNGNCNNVLYGFHPLDEPVKLDRNNLYEWGNYINLTTPGKVTFINFSGGAYWGNVFNSYGRGLYKAHLDHFITPSAPTFYSPDVVGFTYYPFCSTYCLSNPSDSTTLNIATLNLKNYFWALSTTKEKAGSKPLWAIAMSAMHKVLVPRTEPWVIQAASLCSDTVIVQYTDPTYNHLMFMDFCPLAYGAKGLFYFTYDRDHANANYFNAITDSDPLIGTCTQRYEDVKNINHYVKKIVGPVIMNSQWKNAVHKSNLPTNEEQLTSSGELAGDLLTQSHFLISDIENSNILIGTFEQPCDYYLLVVNKDLNLTPSPFKIKLKGDWRFSVSIAPSVGYPPVIVSANPCVPFFLNSSPYNGSTAYSPLGTSYSGQITTFTMPVLQGGEGRMVKISRCAGEAPPGSGMNSQRVNSDLVTFSISPNPTSDILNINLNLSETNIHQQVTLKFTDNYGQLLDEIPVTVKDENTSISYTLPKKVETGLYHLVLNVDGVSLKHLAVQVIR